MKDNGKFIATGFNIKSNEACANIDYKYGPYHSLDEAYETLGEDGDDVIAIGLTVGILTDNGIVEYWFKNGITKEDLVLKGIDPSLIQDIASLKEENAQLKGMLPIEDEDGNGIPDGEDRLQKIEADIASNQPMTDEGYNKILNLIK